MSVRTTGNDVRSRYGDLHRDLRREVERLELLARNRDITPEERGKVSYLAAILDGAALQVREQEGLIKRLSETPDPEEEEEARSWRSGKRCFG